MSEAAEIHPIALGVVTLMTHEATDPSEVVFPPELAAELQAALLELAGSEELRFALAGLLDFVNALEHTGAVQAARALLTAIETPEVLAAVRALNEHRSSIEHEVVSRGRQRFARLTDKKSAAKPALVGAARPKSAVTIDALSFPKYV